MALLNEAMERQGLNMRVSALVLFSFLKSYGWPKNQDSCSLLV